MARCSRTVVGAAILLATPIACTTRVDPDRGGASSPRASAATLIQAEVPPLSDGIFPCMDCHASMATQRTRRELAFHDEQQSIFSHDAEHRWCLDCHDPENRDVLRLIDGSPVVMAESYRLCAQCHADKSRDWRDGVHGKRIGSWNGSKTYLLCVNCHNAHAPRFRGVQTIDVAGTAVVAPSPTPIGPEARPLRPEEQRR